MNRLSIQSALVIAACLAAAGMLTMLTPKRHFVSTGWATHLLTGLFGDNGPAFAMLLGSFIMCIYAMVNWLSAPDRKARRGQKRQRPLS